MKISKLFHWLYACLMLLPIFAFGVTGIYYALNQTATQSETTIEKPKYYNFSDMNTTYNVNELELNTLYRCTIDFDYNSYHVDFEYLAILEMINVSDFDYYELDFQYNENVYLDYDEEGYLDLYCNYSYLNIEGFTTGNSLFLVFAISEDTDWGALPTTVVDFRIEGYTDTELISTPNYETITTTNSVSTSVINAWNDTWSNPLFSWSQDSFLTAPFEYVTNLFSIPSNNTFSMALSYWLAISIIYLVFDLVMYVPLLAHRWIDKGMVE